jgi:hypothetical protein
LRAITVVFVFSRASVLRVRTSSFVHGRSFIFFAISPPYAPTLAANQLPSYKNYERYLILARAKAQAGNPVAAENYYHHAERYFRLMSSTQEKD